LSPSRCRRKKTASLGGSVWCDSGLLRERSAHPDVSAGLPFVLLHGEPLEVFQTVSTASAQGFYVVNLPAWAWAGGGLGSRAGGLPLKLSQYFRIAGNLGTGLHG